MDDRLKELYAQLTGTNLSLQQKKHTLAATLKAVSDEDCERTHKPIMAFYDRMLKARYEPFEEILSQAAAHWALAVGRSASVNNQAPISSIMIWAMEGICKSTNGRSIAIFLSVIGGLIEGDETLKAHQTIPSLTSILLDLKLKSCKSKKLEEAYKDIWEILRQCYPGTVRSLLPVFLRFTLEPSLLSLEYSCMPN